MMFSYYGIKQNVIYSGKWGFATPRNGICSGKRGLALRGETFARQNGASHCAGSHLPDKTGPRVAREAICPTKWGLALRGEAFARQNGASRCAGRHLPDKTGPRVARGGICPTKWGLARSRNAICPTKWDLVNPRTITHPLISYISRSSTPDCPPRRASTRSPSMGRGACRRLAPRRDRGRRAERRKRHHCY